MDETFGEGQVLLLVEDDGRTLQELRRILEKHTGFRVLPCGEGTEALDRAREGRIDIALLDVRLPGMDGLTLLGELRGLQPDLIALVMTGYRESWSARESREKGAVDFLEKPLDLTYLMTVLRQQSRESHVRSDLRRALARLRHLVERVPDGLALLGPGGSVLVSNALGDRFLEAREAGETRFEAAGRTYSLGEYDEDGEILLHWRDLTDAMEAERGRAYRFMSRLLAHELRNPLTPMRLWLQELNALSPGDPTMEGLCRQAVEVLLGQVDRLSALVDQFRTLGQEGPLTPEALNLAAVVEEVRRSLAPLGRSLGVRVELESQGEANVRANRNALFQVLFNIAKNAIEAQEGRDGAVRILSGHAEGDRMWVLVEDRGGGLPAEVAAAPFSPYLTTKSTGTGLGLLVCRELLGRMGADLSIENEPGVGVSVRFSLPLASEE